MINCRDFECPVELTIAIIGGKWKIPIIWHLLERPYRYGELKKLFPKVTQKMLTQQLREMESDGIIHREVYTQIPPKVEYSLTPLGESLRQMLDDLCRWGMSYIDEARRNEAVDKKAN